MSLKDPDKYSQFIEMGQKLGFEEREVKLLCMCLLYNDDPFGAPNHLLMVLVAKLWKMIEELSDK